MAPKRIALLVVGSVLAVLSVGLLAGGGALVGIHATQRDADGFYSSDRRSLETTTYALTSTAIDLELDAGDWRPVRRLGTARIEASRRDGGPVFVGIATSDDVAAYLAGTAHDEVVDFERGREARYARRPGELPAARPAAQQIWVAMASGPGDQELRWEVDDGTWAVVVMNADAEPGVAVDVAVGFRTGLLLPIGIGLLVGATVAGLVAALLILLGARRDDRPAAGHDVGGAGPPTVEGAYPVRLRGALDPELSRGLWLVKWLLVLPHVVVLALLWPVAVVLTLVAGVTILFTGRYPASIFDLNVGVMRWTWRVTFYAFTLGTDRYPPFSLAPDDDYPADLEVDRPETLSRGLVLVKSWLLALPHWVIVAIFGGGFTWWAWGWGSGGDGRFAGGAGLIGVLALVAGVVLLFTGRYPQAIFDLVMGLQRWSYRVFAYAALMRDEYPPFRLDPGGRDPGTPVEASDDG
ncbi:MAG TPA: DUF4389 domain-containing protein [Acidimicrobiales bacterium]|nr:DUF4389 domain-containing protein [Acidimicrobiales bacterium]